MQNHGLEVALVAVLKEFALYVDDGLHGYAQRVLPLLHRVYESLRLVYLFLGIEQRLLGLPRHAFLVVLIGIEHLGKRRRDVQLRYMPSVERKGHAAVFARVYDEVGRYLVDVAPLRLAERRTGLGIELAYFLLQRLCLHAVELECLANLVPMLLGEGLKMMLHHLLHECLQPGVGPPCYLQKQTFLQRARADAGRVKMLQYLQHLLYLGFRGIDVMIYGQLIGYGVERFAQQSVVV